MKSRRERRQEARKNGAKFVPQYNGKKPKTYKEAFGVGYERFDGKYVKVTEVI
ncbi:hypothetical protein [Bacillus chungangensis]|uniref:Uncharacterized protein n=1 Tax=Bacillus chungangensis TaxID=587633 RepID=A0ABT9WMB9_9BACI|nr:hypothetical protein [Bacillus chungangensis]MDQ0174428.1 hypothetical protein [Bacillus chungangensis]